MCGPCSCPVVASGAGVLGPWEGALRRHMVPATPLPAAPQSIASASPGQSLPVSARPASSLPFLLGWADSPDVTALGKRTKHCVPRYADHCFPSAGRWPSAPWVSVEPAPGRGAAWPHRDFQDGQGWGCPGAAVRAKDELKTPPADTGPNAEQTTADALLQGLARLTREGRSDSVGEWQLLGRPAQST